MTRINHREVLDFFESKNYVVDSIEITDEEIKVKASHVTLVRGDETFYSGSKKFIKKMGKEKASQMIQEALAQAISDSEVNL